MSDISDYMLDPPTGTGLFELAWHLWPGLWTESNSGHSRRLLLVFGDAGNRLLVVPVSLDENQVAIPGDTVRSTRELPQYDELIYLWPLEETDKLPLHYGPTVGDYIHRMEAGEGETYV